VCGVINAVRIMPRQKCLTWLSRASGNRADQRHDQRHRVLRSRARRHTLGVGEPHAFAASRFRSQKSVPELID
jgi:hypothetical protein